MTSSIEAIKKLLPRGVNLLAVSKGHDDSLIRGFANFGQLHFGESRLQEALPKISKLKDINYLKWHFIGRLQKNKVRGVIKNFEYIHSVDSFSLLERVSRISGEERKIPKIMLQVKLSNDPTKGGFAPEELLDNWPTILEMSNMNVQGLMTIPPFSLKSNEKKELYKKCREMADFLELKECSMGMSNDWGMAVEAGATWIRIGSLLFGERLKI